MAFLNGRADMDTQFVRGAGNCSSESNLLSYSVIGRGYGIMNVPASLFEIQSFALTQATMQLMTRASPAV
jgi:hypothetical protein